MRISLWILLFACLWSCRSTLNIAEIKTLQRDTFADLILEPAYDFYNIKFDIIRQQQETNVNSMVTTEDVPYHRLSFHLGNGLFMDLNDNVYIDLLTTTSVDKYKNFEVEKKVNQKPHKIYKSIFMDSAFYTMQVTPRKIKSKKSYEVREINNKTVFSNDYKFRAAVSQTEDTLTLFNKKFKPLVKVHKNDDHIYIRKLRKRSRQYQQPEEGINLGTYFFQLNDDKTEIQILKKRKHNNLVIYRIIRDADTVIFFNKKYQGFKIRFTHPGLSVYSNRSKLFDLKAWNNITTE